MTFRMEQTADISSKWLGMTTQAPGLSALESSALDATVIRPLPDETSSPAESAEAGRVELVSGSRPRIENETEALLRVRLKPAAIVLLIAVASFFVRGFFVEDANVRWLQGFVVAILAIFVVVLSSPRTISLPHLRWCEVGIFGLITAYLGIYEYQLVLAKAKAGSPIFELAAIKSCVLYFFAVMLLYGTFIPNTWQRAAKLIIPMAAMPFIVMGCLRLSSTAVNDIAGEFSNFEQISDNVIMMVLGCVASLYGTHIINTLRVEAFRARQMGQY